MISFVSSVGSQQYPASGPVFFAVGIVFGRTLTFSRSVFNTVKVAPPCTAAIGDESGAEIVVRVDGIEEGPGTGRDWDTEPVDVDECCEMVMGRCHTAIETVI